MSDAQGEAPQLREDETMNGVSRRLLAEDLALVQDLADRACMLKMRMHILGSSFHAVAGLLEEYARFVRRALAQDKSPVSESNLVVVQPGMALYVGEKVGTAFGGYVLRNNPEVANAFFEGLGLPVRIEP